MDIPGRPADLLVAIDTTAFIAVRDGYSIKLLHQQKQKAKQVVRLSAQKSYTAVNDSSGDLIVKEDGREITRFPNPTQFALGIAIGQESENAVTISSSWRVIAKFTTSFAFSVDPSGRDVILQDRAQKTVRFPKPEETLKFFCGEGTEESIFSIENWGKVGRLFAQPTVSPERLKKMAQIIKDLYNGLVLTKATEGDNTQIKLTRSAEASNISRYLSGSSSVVITPLTITNLRSGEKFVVDPMELAVALRADCKNGEYPYQYSERPGGKMTIQRLHIKDWIRVMGDAVP